MLTEAQLRQRMETGKGVVIAESLTVLSRALDAGYEPIAGRVGKKHVEGQAALMLAHCGDIPGYTA